MPTAPPSIVITEIRGKIGQWVYARDAGGPLRRPWKEHRSMSSPAQDAQRLIYKAVYPRWSGNLTEAQRTAWRAFTENYPRQDQLGHGYCPSGQSRFNGCNSISWKYAAAWLDDPPQTCIAISPPPSKLSPPRKHRKPSRSACTAHSMPMSIGSSAPHR